ncbi:MAG: TIGR04283 family arsenosugar biosynthesis glycosyltransferase [Deltaproteobacteria bacterium]|nr:TIGR04283 family arsenosugar biosynthesis glycosyltransferase [Deltaproteobacteria bacterium]
MYISVIIPVLNEEANIEKAVLSAKASDEIIVVDGGSSDATVSIAERLGVKVINTENGRGGQQDAGAREANGNVFLFLHADTILPSGWKDMIEMSLIDNNIIGGAFLLGIDSSRRSLYFISLIANIRARYLGLIYGDQAIFVRKDVFFRVDGFKGLPIMEDIDFIRRLKKQGKVKLIEEKVLTSDRRWMKSGIIKNTIKNWFFLFNYYLGVSPEWIYRWYYKGTGKVQ